LGLQRVINDVPIGSLLVQSDSKTGEPLLFQVKLPNCIRERHRAVNTWVFLLDAQACFLGPDFCPAQRCSDLMNMHLVLS